MINRIIKGVGIVLAVGLASEILYQTYLWLKRRHRKTESRTESSISEVLFFPDRMVACKDYFIGEHGCSNLKCRFTHEPNSLSSLYKHLAGCRTSLDVCVFVICCSDLGDVIIDAHRRGVKVRVICDDEQIDITGSQIWRMRSEGKLIPVIVFYGMYFIDQNIAGKLIKVGNLVMPHTRSSFPVPQ